MQGGGLWPRISWNPPDFTLKSGGFHLWNPAEFTQISSMKSTQNYKSKCFSKNSSVWWMQGGGYDQGLHEIRKKSGGFHVKSKDLLQGIVTLCFVYMSDWTKTTKHISSLASTVLAEDSNVRQKEHTRIPLFTWPITWSTCNRQI